MQQISCKHCKKHFIPHGKRDIFCSMTCFREWRKLQHWEDHICQSCGKTFKFLLCINHTQPNNGKYCSKQCEWNSKRVVLTCARCGKEFHALKCKSSRKYCSQECAGVAKKDKVKRICVVCQSEYYVIPSKIEITKCCSRECQSIYTYDLMGWKGHVPDYAKDKLKQWKQDNKNRLSGKQWKEIRTLVLQRDEHKCTACSAVDNIVIHHIIPWLKDQSDNQENLVTLCRPCHMRVERLLRAYPPL